MSEKTIVKTCLWINVGAAALWVLTMYWSPVTSLIGLVYSGGLIVICYGVLPTYDDLDERDDST